MRIYVFNKTKTVTNCGNAKHIYLPVSLAGNKVVGVVVADDNENITYQHTQLKKCADCSMIHML